MAGGAFDWHGTLFSIENGVKPEVILAHPSSSKVSGRWHGNNDKEVFLEGEDSEDKEM